MKFKIISCIILCFTGISLLHSEKVPEYFSHNSFADFKLADIVVGTKINDSTGQSTISTSDIQASIISNIKVLGNVNISNDAPTIAIGQQFSYLVFRASSLMSPNIEVAVEVTVVGNVVKFQNLPGKQVHVWQSRGTCTSCGFFQDWQNNIIDCNCNSSGQSVDNSNGGCDHLIFFIE